MTPIDSIESCNVHPVLSKYPFQRFAWQDDTAVPLHRSITGVMDLAGTTMFLGESACETAGKTVTTITITTICELQNDQSIVVDMVDVFLSKAAPNRHSFTRRMLKMKSQQGRRELGNRSVPLGYVAGRRATENDAGGHFQHPAKTNTATPWYSQTTDPAAPEFPRAYRFERQAPA